MSPLALSIKDATKVSGKCRAGIYNEIKKGRLRAVKDGRKTLILVRDLQAYLDNLPAIKAAA